MYNDRLKTLKTVVIVVVIIGLLAVIAYAVYGFSLLWATFAAGITMGLLLILIVLLLVIVMYFWIKNLLLKGELNRTKNGLKQTKIDLNKCRAKLNSNKLEESE